MKLLYYNPTITANRQNYDLPGMEKFGVFFKIFNPNVVMIDRTNTVRIPVSIESLFPMPAFRRFGDSLEDICNARASELLKRAETFDCKLHVFWSGGIDSTLMLVSFLKNATPAQKKRIIVLLSEESLNENPRFYDEHIRPSLEVEVSSLFPHLFGTPHLFVGAEHNDQVFGSDKVAQMINTFGPGVIHKKYDRSMFFELFNASVKNPEHTNFYLDLFEKLRDRCPVPIETNYLFLWWINFSLKWQSVFTRMLAYTSPRNVPKMTRDYITNNYLHFYNTEEFQLWSMNNTDKRIKDSWTTYKYPCKDIIYDFTKDAHYRDTKVKVGSLYFLFLQREAYNFIDSDMRFHRSLSRDAYYDPDNDFI